MINKNNLRFLTNILVFPTFLLTAYTIYLVFMVVPNEKVMGAVQRIFYFHVGFATASYVAIALMFIGSIAYLATRDYKMDLLAASAAEVALLLCTLVLVSGMIWGHAAWNTWFSWEPRLVTFLLLWLLLVSYNLLRAFSEPEKIGVHCAVLGILGAVNVPIVVYSIKLLPNIAQLHPQVVENQGLKDPLFVSTMFYALAAAVLIQFVLVVIRFRISILERE